MIITLVMGEEVYEFDIQDPIIIGRQVSMLPQSVTLLFLKCRKTGRLIWLPEENVKELFPDCPSVFDD